MRLHGPRDLEARGGTVAFNLLKADGGVVPYHDVELRARDHGVAIRGGCFCNPGAAEAAFGFDGLDVTRCLDQLEGRFSVEAFRSCLGDAAVGALRLSVGAPTTLRDLDRAIGLIATFDQS